MTGYIDEGVESDKLLDESETEGGGWSDTKLSDDIDFVLGSDDETTEIALHLVYI